MADRTEPGELEDNLERRPPVDVGQFVEWYEQFGNNTIENRQLQLRDVKYIHHKQLTPEEKEKLRARNQPEVVYNRIAPKVNFIRGYETRTRIDPSARPRTPAHKDDAIASTDALRAAADIADFDNVRSILTEELLGPGQGGAVLGVDQDTRDITLTQVRGDRLFYDPHSREPDFSDARFIGTVVWWDYEDAVNDERYAGRKQLLDDSLSDNIGSRKDWDPHEDRPSVWLDPIRKRFRIVEIYYRDLAPAEDGDGNPILDEDGEQKMRKEWHLCHFTKAGALVDPKIVPFRDEKGRTFCPLVATSAFIDEENNRYSIVRGMIDAQDEINKRRSRALWEAIMRAFIYEEDAMEDPDEFATEVAKADGKAKVAFDAIKEQRFKFLDTPADSQSQIALYQDAKNEINSVGPSMPNIAGDQGALSGRASLAKQNIGSMELETIFDNIRRWQKQIFTRMWWMIRKLWTEEKWLRVRDSTRKEGYRFVAVNRDTTRGERVMELVHEHEVPIDSAVYQVGLPITAAQRLLAESQQAARQEMMVFMQQQQAMMQQAQQMGQQVPQQDPQMMQKQMEQNMLALIIQAPVMQEPIRMNDIAALEVDILIDATPDTTIAAQEEQAELVEMIGNGLFNIPNTAVQRELINNSNLRNRDAIANAVDKQPDPKMQQIQQQQMQLQMMQQQAVIEKLKAEVQRLQAEAAQKMAQAQLIPVEAQRVQAQTQRTHAQTQRDIAHVQVTVPAQAERDKAEAIKDITTANLQNQQSPGVNQ